MHLLHLSIICPINLIFFTEKGYKGKTGQWPHCVRRARISKNSMSYFNLSKISAKKTLNYEYRIPLVLISIY